MPPAAQHAHRHRHRKAQTVTIIEHQGARDVTSTYEIVRPSVTVSSSAIFMMSPAASRIDATSLSPSPTALAASLVPAFSPTTPLITPTPHATATTPSNYPRPSAPVFLYPHPIVPPHVSERAMQRANEQHAPPSLNHSLTHQQPYISTPSIAVLAFLLLAIAGAWAVVVMLIHWRGTTTGMSTARSRPRSGDDGARSGSGWWAWPRDRRPWARGGERYEAISSAEHELDDFATGKTSAHDVHAPADDGRGSGSPVNPFLVAPDQSVNRRVKARSSAEWAEQHRIYFSSPSGSRGHSSPHSLSSAELKDVEAEAREAQGRRASLAWGDAVAVAGRNDYRSWVDLGLAAVDGAVDRLAGKIVRYTDDGGKVEALLLPLAKGKQE